MSLTFTRVSKLLSIRCLLKPASSFNVHSNQAKITTAAPLQILEAKPEGKRSWVTKVLRGSGPAAEAEESEETVEVEPQYMELLKEKKESFIEKPETRKRVYTPSENVEDVIFRITELACPELDPGNWKATSLNSASTKYKVLTECSRELHHDVPNYMLSRMSTVEDVITFYQDPVKDTTKFDELSTQDLPKNLKIHWEYEDDSQLEIYQEYLDYTRVKKTGPPSKYPFKEDLF